MKRNQIFVGILGLKSNFRGDQLLKKVHALGIKPEVVWGIPVAEIGIDRLRNYSNQEQAKYIMGREMTMQEVSCALGHLEMYESFLTSGKQVALFLEDDADFNENLEEILGMEYPLDRPAVLQIGGYLDPQLLPNPLPATFPKFGESFRSNPGILRCLQFPVYAHGYLMNRAAALAAVHLMRNRKINSPADFPFVWRSSIPIYITVKQITWQRDSMSGLEGNRRKLELEMGVSSNFKRRVNRIWALSPFYLIHGRNIGLSGRAVIREKVFYYLLSRYYPNAKIGNTSETTPHI
jgi:hypothetical protein